MRVKIFLVLTCLCLCASGCGTAPLHEVEVLPAPIRNFPLPKNAIVRVPIEIRFSDKGGFAQPLADLFKSGTLDIMPFVDAIPGFKGRLGGCGKKCGSPFLLIRRYGLRSIRLPWLLAE